MPNIVTKDGTIIHFTSAGTGYPLVFLHGWSLSGEVWQSQKAYFSPSFRCIFPDLRGHGRSSSPGSGYGMESFCSDLAELFEHLDLTEACLICWSFSVPITLCAYPSLKRRLRALVFVSGTPKFTATEDFPWALSVRDVRGLSLRLRRNYREALEGFFRMMFSFREASGTDSERITADFLPLWQQPPQNSALLALETLALTDMRDRLKMIDIPVHLIHGDSDSICHPEASRYMEERIPTATLSLLEATGHAPLLSTPAHFNDIVRRFLERVYGQD